MRLSTPAFITRRLAAFDRLVTADRVRAWAIVLLIGYAAGLAWLLLTMRHGLDPRGRPIGADFIAFYSASRMTLGGKAALAYAGQPLLDLQRAILPGLKGACPWFYPPTLQLLIWPLSRLPYGAALAVWSALGLGGYLAMMRGFSRDRRALLLSLAFPGVYMCIAQGQTGLFVAALMGAGLTQLDRRPWLAGGLIGLAIIKPQFAVLAPLLLAVSGRWKGFVAAGVVSLGLAAAATLAFGWRIWPAFLAAGPSDALALTSGALPIFKDPSIFAYLTWLGVSTPVAMAAHAGAALAAVWLCVSAWRRPGPQEVKAGLAVLATLIVLPFEFDYDLALLAIPIAAALKRSEGAPAGVKGALALLALTPILVAPLTRFLDLPIGPFALWAGMAALLQIDRAAAEEARPAIATERRRTLAAGSPI